MSKNINRVILSDVELKGVFDVAEVLECRLECVDSESEQPERKRIYLLDEIRGAAVIAMVLYHIFYSAGEVFTYESVHNIFQIVRPFEPIIPLTFVFISGICTRLSRSNLRRGGILFLIALVINIVTDIFVPQIVIRFGVINLLSVCMLLYGLCRKGIEQINCKVGFFFSLFLFVLTWGVSDHYIGLLSLRLFELPDYLYHSGFLFPLGFRTREFYSSDYFPLFPWLFLFLSGSFFWGTIKYNKLPETLYKVHCKFLSAVGKYAVIIYVVHQPIIFGVLYLMKFIG